LLSKYLSDCDIVITTAQIPGKPAPILISKAMIAKMRPGAVIVDLAAASGGNTAVTRACELVHLDGVKVIGYHLAQDQGRESSLLYAKNLYNFVQYAFEGRALKTQDDLIKKVMLTYQGKVLYGL
jgi:NAD(P) transhydrogenase subunit alpha